MTDAISAAGGRGQMAQALAVAQKAQTQAPTQTRAQTPTQAQAVAQRTARVQTPPAANPATANLATERQARLARPTNRPASRPDVPAAPQRPSQGTSQRAPVATGQAGADRSNWTANLTERPARTPTRPDAAFDYARSAVRSEASERFEYLRDEGDAAAETRAETRAEQEAQEPGGTGGAGANADEIRDAARSFRDYLNNLPAEMNFSYDEDAERSVFRLVNPVTGEVLKQFPPDEFLTMVKRLREVSYAFDNGGALVDYRL